MKSAFVAVAIASCAIGAQAQFRYLGYERDEHRMIATPPCVPANRAMAWHGVSCVGREFVGRPVIGAIRQPIPLDWGGPGPAAYGADEYDFSLVYTRVGNVVVSVSPWIAINGEGPLKRMEAGRLQWLREHGYVGGTRTFYNPVARYHPELLEDGGEGRQSSALDGEGWNVIRIPVKPRPKFEVRANDPGVRIVTSIASPMTIVSTPSTSSIAAAE